MSSRASKRAKESQRNSTRRRLNQKSKPSTFNQTSRRHRRRDLHFNQQIRSRHFRLHARSRRFILPIDPRVVHFVKLGRVLYILQPNHARQQSVLRRPGAFQQRVTFRERFNRLFLDGIRARTDLSAKVRDAVVDDDLAHARVLETVSFNIARTRPRSDDVGRFTSTERRGRTTTGETGEGWDADVRRAVHFEGHDDAFDCEVWLWFVTNETRYSVVGVREPIRIIQG
jgi:hypothetical protein